MKVAIITSTRAEYGLLYPLIKAMTASSAFDVDVIVTGTHLLKKYGQTITFIKQDGIKISYEIPIMKEHEESVSKVIARAVGAFDTVYEKENYESIVVLGDRYELYGFCIPAMMRRIPIIHLHGGEKTEGALDERIRHSITKMASIHFPSICEYANRIIQMGENPDCVFPVGAIGIDNIMSLKPISKNELEDDIKISFNKKTALVTFHPVTCESKEEICHQVVEVFSALVESELTCIVTMPNSDTGGDITIKIIYDFVQAYPQKFIFIKSLGQNKYLSVLKYVSLVIGNSSSGIIEAPSFCVPTIDIGDRQQGRYAPKTVIHCECDKRDILHSIEKALSSNFQDSIKEYINPYGDGHTAEKIVSVLSELDLSGPQIIKKIFYDLEFKGKVAYD